ncbi:MAG: hypothetical protein JWQ47_2278 [Glaciihabitans sp.]|nr:hypothetical protein [Glaciihabitans sp.]
MTGDRGSIPSSAEEFVDVCVRSIITDGGSHDVDVIDAITTWANLKVNPMFALVSIARIALQGYAGAVQGMYDDEAAAFDYLDRLAVLTEAMVVLENLDTDGTVGDL